MLTNHKYSLFKIYSQYVTHIHFISIIFRIVIYHSQMVIICYLCSPYSIYGWPWFTIYVTPVHYIYISHIHHLSSLVEISSSYVTYVECIPHMYTISHLLSEMFPYVTYIHKMSSIFILFHILLWYVHLLSPVSGDIWWTKHV